MVIFLLLIGALFIVIDQALKYWAVTVLMPVGSMDFIKIGGLDILGFYYTQNDGAAFSSFSGARYFLIIVNIILMAGLIIFAFRSKGKHKFINIPVTLIVSGGLGNIIDRIRLGYVIDYLEVRLFNFAIFNFADICVVVGAFLLAFYTIVSDVKARGGDLGDKGD
ncbi:MAG: signal peptidase II [Oscillospiraceae bacterium]|nr:signal peptidase II [Oscillospiraceae bacterium]